MATYTSMPPCNIREIRCKIKGQISKLELRQPIKIPTKESGPNNWAPGAKRQKEQNRLDKINKG